MSNVQRISSLESTLRTLTWFLPGAFSRTVTNRLSLTSHTQQAASRTPRSRLKAVRPSLPARRPPLLSRFC